MMRAACVHTHQADGEGVKEGPTISMQPGAEESQPVKNRPGPLQSSRLWACIYCPLEKCHQVEGCPGGWEERQSPLVGCPY